MWTACYELWADYIHQKNSGSSERSIAKMQVKSVGSLSKDVFEQCPLTRSETVSLLICKNASKFVFLRAFSFIKVIQPKIWGKHCPITKTDYFRLTCVAPKHFTNSKTSDLTPPNPNKLNSEQHGWKWVLFEAGGGGERGVKWWTQSQSKKMLLGVTCTWRVFIQCPRLFWPLL